MEHTKFIMIAIQTVVFNLCNISRKTTGFGQNTTALTQYHIKNLVGIQIVFFAILFHCHHDFHFSRNTTTFVILIILYHKSVKNQVHCKETASVKYITSCNYLCHRKSICFSYEQCIYKIGSAHLLYHRCANPIFPR